MSKKYRSLTLNERDLRLKCCQRLQPESYMYKRDPQDYDKHCQNFGQFSLAGKIYCKKHASIISLGILVEDL